MTESMLQSLMKLFALMATINVDATAIFSRNFVETYLKGQFSPKMVERSITIFEKNLEDLKKDKPGNPRKRIASLSVKILRICDEINSELPLRSKFLILFSIIQFSRHFEAHSRNPDEFREIVKDTVDTISEALLISSREYEICRSFITDRFHTVPDRSRVLVVNSLQSVQFKGIRHLRKDDLNGQFFFLKIIQADLYIFYYSGSEKMELGGRVIFPNHVYVLPKGSSINIDGVAPLYYGDVVAAYHRESKNEQISLTAKGIAYTYPGSENGIHEMNLDFVSGEMAGVMGGSGTGKSTLMKILNGRLKPDRGTIEINGIRLNPDDSRQNGIIGFVPQDDLLIEELTVFENLYYNAKLCLGDLSEAEIIKRIGKVLNSLGLFYIKDMKVGSPMKKYISGGQRKRLNIALELIREPYILFVDEPTSGLSSTDSENVMTLLREQALSGKIIVINIHQPSSDLFKLFDKIVIMDKGGYPVYFGNPLGSVTYLKKVARRADASEIQCETCGVIHTDDILKIIEAKKVNEFGEYTRERFMEPKDWYKLFREQVDHEPEPLSQGKLPDLNLHIPGRLRQLIIYGTRNFVSKIADRQFISLALIIAPALALILGYFTKNLGGTENGQPVYIFSRNENLPAYLFMCVIVSLFVGMIISAEDLIRDRKIREREAFLGLSRFSYLNSKIIFLFFLSAIQMFVFVLVGNSILGIRNINLNFWLIMFSTSCFAVMLGLNISASLKSVISIYISIPFILVPLILLSGVIVNYDKLHPRVAGIEHVPLAGNIMASRWAYEALVVNQFRNNTYERHFFTSDQQEANLLYNINFLIPELQNKLDDLTNALERDDQQRAEYLLRVINNSFPRHQGLPPALESIDPSPGELALALDYLQKWRGYMLEQLDSAREKKDSLVMAVAAELGGPEKLVQLKRDYHNEAVAELVLNSNELEKIVEFRDRLVRRYTPVYQLPASKTGRAQFFAASKYIGKHEVDTIRFDIAILWLMTIVLYIALANNWLSRLLYGLGRRGKQSESAKLM